MCRGGGQALGLERAGFAHAVLVENDPDACSTLRLNRPWWHAVESDVREFRWTGGRVDLLAAGLSSGWLAHFSQAVNGPMMWDESDRPTVVRAMAQLTGRPESEVEELVDEDDALGGLWLVPLGEEQLVQLPNQFAVTVGDDTIEIEIDLP